MNPAPQPGIVKARRAIRNARRSLEDGDADFAASRAYYAMFYAAATLLSSLGLHFTKHSAVIAHFNRRFVRSGLLPERHGFAFRTAFDRRSIGDYDYVIDFPPEVAQAVIDDAVAFIDAAEAYLARLQNPPTP